MDPIPPQTRELPIRSSSSTPSEPSRARAFLELLQPGFLGGFRLADWFRLLSANGWAVDPACIPRALVATCSAAATSALAALEPAPRLPAEVEEAWRHPLFIVGLPRSGTTHLFELLARDPAFCAPTRLDCYYPHCFRTLRRLGIDRLLGRIPLRRRIQDEVRTGWGTPEEDVLALSVLGGLGWNLGHVFPRLHDGTWADVAPLGDTEAFRAALTGFTRQLVALHRRPLLLKSPSHLQWIPGILGVFPAARFVTIFRDPIRRDASQRAAWSQPGLRWSSLQRMPARDDARRTEAVERILDRYFSTNRALIPPQQLVEIRHEDLVADEIGTLRQVRDGLAHAAPARLGLSAPDDSTGRAPIHAARPYAPNVHPEPDAPTRARIRRAYRLLYDRGYYRPPAAIAPGSRD